MSSLQHRFIYHRDMFVTVAYLVALLAMAQRAFAWGREGLQIMVIVADRYMRPETTTRMREVLASRGISRAVIAAVFLALTFLPQALAGSEHWSSLFSQKLVIWPRVRSGFRMAFKRGCCDRWRRRRHMPPMIGLAPASPSK